MNVMIVLSLILVTDWASGGSSQATREALTELSLSELLSRKKNLEEGKKSHIINASSPYSLPLTESNHGGEPEKNMHIRGLHRLPARKSFYDYESEEEDWFLKKEPKSKFAKLFEVSVTALSFMAFGSYLLCLMAYVMKSKDTDTLAAIGTTVSPQIQLLQQILRPNKSFPFRVPSFPIHSGRKRRKRSTSHKKITCDRRLRSI